VSFAGSPAGETESVTLTINGDSDPEIVEQFWLEMTSLSGMSSSLMDISDNASVTITDNDQAVITIANEVVSEGNNATLTLNLDKAIGAGFSVDLSTVAGTARLSDGDYSNPSTPTVTFSATGNNQSRSVTVPITDDSVVESSESFVVGLTNLSAGYSSLVDITDTATVTINDNDGQATVTINDNNTAENSGSLTFTLSLDKATNDNFTVEYQTIGISATGGVDYTSKTDNVSFSGSAGETQTVTISLWVIRWWRTTRPSGWY